MFCYTSNHTWIKSKYCSRLCKFRLMQERFLAYLDIKMLLSLSLIMPGWVGLVEDWDRLNKKVLHFEKSWKLLVHPELKGDIAKLPGGKDLFQWLFLLLWLQFFCYLQPSTNIFDHHPFLSLQRRAKHFSRIKEQSSPFLIYKTAPVNLSTFADFFFHKRNMWESRSKRRNKFAQFFDHEYN